MTVYRPIARTATKCWPWAHVWTVFSWHTGWQFEYSERYCDVCGLCHVKGQTTHGKWRDPDEWY